MQYGLSIAFSHPDEYCQLAKAAEERGFSWVTLADHLIYPQTFSVPYPYTPDGKPRFSDSDPFPDPWITVTAMAAVTQTIGFYTNIFVLPARNPFHVAKILATTSVFSQGRVALGVGMGWMPEEFAASEQPFRNRGRRADEMLEVMKKLWSGDWVEHHGEFYDFDPLRMVPAPVKPIPVYVGGISDPALKRAARNDGWISDLHTTEELLALIDKLNGYREQAGTLDRDFDILCFNPVDAFTPESHQRLEEAGVTTITTAPWAMQALNGPVALDEKLKLMDQFAEQFIR